MSEGPPAPPPVRPRRTTALGNELPRFQAPAAIDLECPPPTRPTRPTRPAVAESSGDEATTPDRSSGDTTPERSNAEAAPRPLPPRPSVRPTEPPASSRPPRPIRNTVLLTRAEVESFRSNPLLSQSCDDAPPATPPPPPSRRRPAAAAGPSMTCSEPVIAERVRPSIHKGASLDTPPSPRSVASAVTSTSTGDLPAALDVWRLRDDVTMLAHFKAFIGKIEDGLMRYAFFQAAAVFFDGTPPASFDHRLVVRNLYRSYLSDDAEQPVGQLPASFLELAADSDSDSDTDSDARLDAIRQQLRPVFDRVVESLNQYAASFQQSPAYARALDSHATPLRSSPARVGLASRAGAVLGAAPTRPRSMSLDKHQSSPPSSLAPLQQQSGGDDEESRRRRHQQMIIEEIIKTEGDYVNYLKLSMEVFFQPLRKERRDVLSAEKLDSLSHGIDVLCSLHGQISADLSGKQTPAALIAAFAPYVPHLKLYADYCTKNSESMLLLGKCLKHNVDFKEFHEQVRRSEPRLNKLGLEDILMMPIQRICKYPLLFRELKKTTKPGSDEEAAVQGLESSLEQVAQHVNERKRDAENNRVILKIQASVEGLNMRQFFAKKRQFVATMRVYINANDIRRKLFLFDDLLLVTTRQRVGRGRKYELKQLLKLDDCLAVYNVDATATFPHPLEMVDSNGKDPTVYTIGFQSGDDKQKFFDEMAKTQVVTADYRGVERRAPVVSYLPKQLLVQEQFDLSDLHQRLLQKSKASADSIDSIEAPQPKFTSSSLASSSSSSSSSSPTPSRDSGYSSNGSQIGSGSSTPETSRRAWARRSTTTSSSTADLLRRNLEVQQQQNEETRRSIADLNENLALLRRKLDDIRNRYGRSIIDEFLSSLRNSQD